MDTVIGVGLIGLGTIGRSHARALDALRDRAELRAFSGGDTSAAAETGWPDAAQVAPGELLDRDDVDVVTICSRAGCTPSRPSQRSRRASTSSSRSRWP